MHSRLEKTVLAQCYGNYHWMDKRDVCKHLDQYKAVDCDYIQAKKFCYNTEKSHSEVVLSSQPYQK